MATSENVTTPNVVFRKEQETAINGTIRLFKSSRKMLWDAKMRFGKTLCALEVVRRMGYKRTLILTHRPVVRDGWFKDFAMLGFDHCEYGCRMKGAAQNEAALAARPFAELEKRAVAEEDFKYVYFASIQDMRGSKKVNKKSGIDKNDEIFAADWDLLIIDEAHEGIATALGRNVVGELQKHRKLRSLYLSGTPYNIIHLFDSKEIYRWDYNMEQEAKETWPKEHPDEENPYEGLAKLNIITYNMGSVFGGYSQTDDDYFSFSEFFRVEENADRFLHEADVRRFLQLISTDSPKGKYPFSTSASRRQLCHTLWSVPGVRQAKCLARLLAEPSPDNFFRDYTVVNVAGEGDMLGNVDNIDEKDRKEADALERVKKAIAASDKTITLTCGRLTMGVSVPEWTGVLMLSGSYDTRAARYFQTIFRSQTPYRDGQVKHNCYAFDFAPDRTLTVIDQYVNNTKSAGGAGARNKAIDKFLHYCPVTVVDGGKMTVFDSKRFIQQVNKAYSEHIIKNGFKDGRLYTNLGEMSDEDFQLLSRIGTAITKGRSLDEIPAADDGDTIVQPQPQTPVTRLPRKPKLTAAERKSLEEIRMANALEVLNKITTRFPLMIYGSMSNVKTLSMSSFVKSIDEESWREFMPEGLTRDVFLKLAHLYRGEIFVATATSIIERIKAADAMGVADRVNEIARILSEFRYPDKETVLTPWKVVNRHMSDMTGGYDFFDEAHRTLAPQPRFVDRGDVTNRIYRDPKTKVLDINSKTGLYPLYAAYTIFRMRCDQEAGLFGLSEEREEQIWAEVVSKCIFVLCKTKMAQMISHRTLAGYSKLKTNVQCLDTIIDDIKDHPADFVKKVSDGKNFWKANSMTKMKFNAIVGNPPYQQMDGGNGVSAKPVYNYFMEASRALAPEYITLIMPSRWFAGGKGLDAFRESMLTDRRMSKMTDFVNSKDCFPLTSIGGGVDYFLWDAAYKGDCLFTVVKDGHRDTESRNLNEFPVFIRYNKAVNIIHRVMGAGEKSLMNVVSARNPFNLPTSTRGAEAPSDDTVKLVSSEGVSHIDRKEVDADKTLVDSYKVMMSRATCEHAGEPDKSGMFRVVSRLEVLEPGTICTDSYIVVMPTLSQEEAENCKKYLQTRFARFLILQSVSSINLTRDKFKFVPMQDFTAASDIDWKRPVAVIDRLLCEKYGLDKEESLFIWKMIKAM